MPKTHAKKSANKKIEISIPGGIAKKIEKGMEEGCKPKTIGCHGHCGGAIYGLGFIGAAVYYISTATGFWNGVWGVIKALLWPAFLVHGALKFLGL